MGFRLDFDFRAFALGPVEEERVLLARAQAGNEVAAAQLLLLYENGDLRDPVVKNTVVLGQGIVTRHIAMSTLGPPRGRALSINPRMFFMGVEAKGKTAKKTDVDTRLTILAQSGVRLPEEHIREALAGRPATLHRAEAALIRYVRKLYKGASEGAARTYVHGAFPEVNWELRDHPVAYSD